MKFRQAVREVAPHLEHIPAGYHRYGSVMVLRSNQQLSEDLGQACCEIYTWCETVYQHLSTVGESRIPKLVLLAGRDAPEVVHRENGVSYLIDLRRITFSGGNRHLRERLVEMIEDGEYLLDMFAAVGNLSMQPLVHHQLAGAVLVEQNSYTFQHLLKTLELNGLSTNNAINLDCRKLDLENYADRILMGFHDVDHTHLTTALRAAKPKSVLHLHPIVPVDNWDDEVQKYHRIITNLDARILETNMLPVKSYAPGLEHIELIFEIAKN